jgi:2-keto-3-deoxy-L-rhamnonate aldolase RhmA
MKENKMRSLLGQNLPTVGTRVWSSWPTITEAVGASGNFDYVEFVVEYAPFSQYDLENICRAAELHNMGTMIKVDFQNRAYVAQKALASGFQSVLLTDHRTADQVKESIGLIRPDSLEHGGSFGYSNRRWIGFQMNKKQMDYAKMVSETVVAIMIEKKEAMDNIESICAVPGVDMVQFGPSDYSMSRGWNAAEHVAEYKEAEREMIKVALKQGVHPRCEINTSEEAKYYIDLGVKHFCIGDEMKICMNYWNNVGGEMKKMANTLK